MKDWIVETRVVTRRVYLVQADDEKEAIFASTQVPPEVDEDEFEETMSVMENPAGSVAVPEDGTCCRCGAAPRNASGLCATCLDEDAERAGEIQSQALWRQALDAEQVRENGPAGLADAHSKSPAPSSQSERIAVLEAALRPFAKAADDSDILDDIRIGVVKEDHDIWESSAAMSITFGNLRDAHSALAPLGEAGR